ncbi:HTH-type transcriptional regulator BetI [Austwickia sp. TVS 96-490-7B]|uniref:TetR/AcrR family transcriptional regulator n=1 Tax=Austwickia sp. TVS 96-490-7B TaxID=2830843 RepID=UPI001E1392C1|nr:TetR/AcrR family transcriptional regulator [Austwickia sp. TVS 96-490-7B]MBW3086625.1 HTH-type transcriptional regulator BetI [Austwickia sp. TVS 96-490-7B]
MNTYVDHPGPGRGTRLSRPARRAMLLQAAQEVFVSAGYHAAAMDEIAERAGVSKPVLYQHFPGKMELYLALLDDANEQLMATVLSALQSASTNVDRVAATMDAYFGFVARERTPYRLVFESDLVNDPAVRDRLETVENAIAEAIAPLMQEQTSYTPDEALLLAMGVVGMAQQSARFWQSRRTEIPQDAAARLIASLAFKGIKRLPRDHEEIAQVFAAD